MQVQITLYGAMRVIAGQPRVDLPFASPSITLSSAIEALITAYPRVRSYVLDASGALHASIRVIRNDERVIADDLLAIPLYDGDRIALLSPMAGGAIL